MDGERERERERERDRKVSEENTYCSSTSNDKLMQ